MDTIWIVILIVVALLILGGIALAMRKRREAQLEEQREVARGHREEAGAQARKAEQARVEAEEEAARARRQQEAAEEQAELARRQERAAEDLRRRADEVDPDVVVDEPEETPRR
jgi:FtsZ-interacting cell division protein ZipA